jgi:hypothetical protein
MKESNNPIKNPINPIKNPIKTLSNGTMQENLINYIKICDNNSDALDCIKKAQLFIEELSNEYLTVPPKEGHSARQFIISQITESIDLNNKAQQQAFAWINDYERITLKFDAILDYVFQCSSLLMENEIITDRDPNITE